MEAGEDANYPFDYWCALLGVDEEYMKDNFRAFLDEQRANANRGKRGSFKILRKLEAVRVVQPHVLSLHDHYPDGKLYTCSQCHQTAPWEHFLASTCTRTQPVDESVLKGLREAAEGKTAYIGSFAKYDEGIDE